MVLLPFLHHGTHFLPAAWARSSLDVVLIAVWALTRSEVFLGSSRPQSRRDRFCPHAPTKKKKLGSSGDTYITSTGSDYMYDTQVCAYLIVALIMQTMCFRRRLQLAQSLFFPFLYSLCDRHCKHWRQAGRSYGQYMAALKICNALHFLVIQCTGFCIYFASCEHNVMFAGLA